MPGDRVLALGEAQHGERLAFGPVRDDPLVAPGCVKYGVQRFRVRPVGIQTLEGRGARWDLAQVFGGVERVPGDGVVLVWPDAVSVGCALLAGDLQDVVSAAGPGAAAVLQFGDGDGGIGDAVLCGNPFGYPPVGGPQVVIAVIATERGQSFGQHVAVLLVDDWQAGFGQGVAVDSAQRAFPD